MKGLVEGLVQGQDLCVNKGWGRGRYEYISRYMNGEREFTLAYTTIRSIVWTGAVVLAGATQSEVGAGESTEVGAVEGTDAAHVQRQALCLVQRDTERGLCRGGAGTLRGTESAGIRAERDEDEGTGQGTCIWQAHCQGLW